MIPELSTTVHSTSFESKQGRRTLPLIAYCVGGTTLGDFSTNDTQWVAEVVGNEVQLRVEGADSYVVILTGENIEFISLAFDTAMNYVLSYMQGGVAKMLYYTGSVYATLTLPAGTKRPFVALDVIEQVLFASSDVILSYIRDNNLYARVQRESFETERLLKAAAGSDIVRFGRNTGNRLQWRLLPI
jgi:hypothetical protein